MCGDFVVFRQALVVVPLCVLFVNRSITCGETSAVCSAPALCYEFMHRAEIMSGCLGKKDNNEI